LEAKASKELAMSNKRLRIVSMEGRTNKKVVSRSKLVFVTSELLGIPAVLEEDW
jgi:hypothetical protein